MTGVIVAAGLSAAAGLAAPMLAGNKGGAGGGQGQMQQQQLPEWINNGLMQNYGSATDWSYRMPGPYQGDRVANMTPGMENLIGQQYANVGSTDPYFNTALQQTNALSGFGRDPLSVQRLAGTDLSPYMNPYTQGVINPAIAQMEQARRISLGQIGDQATQAKAFGGSRQGVAEGVTNAQSELQKGGFVSNLMGQNFLQAQQAAVGDITRGYTADAASRANQLQDAQFQAEMARQYGSLAGSRQSNFLAGLDAAMKGQGMFQEQDQREIDAQRAYYDEQRMDPLQRIQMRQAFLTNTPATPTSYTSGPATSGNPFMSGIGAASSTAGLLGTLGKGGLWGSTPSAVDTNAVMRQAIPTDVWGQYGVGQGA